MTVRTPDVDKALADAIDQLLDEVDCSNCNRPGHHHTVRVTAFGPTGKWPDIEMSQYACDECAPTILAIVRRLHPNAGVYDLPGKAHPQKLPLDTPDPARHVDLHVADQVEKLLTRAPARTES